MCNARDNNKERKIGSLGLVFLGLGSVIGGSFFLGSGIAIQKAGPSVVLGYLIGGVITYLVLVSLGHLALRYKNCESFRDYVQEVIGPSGGFMVGWVAWLMSVIGMVAEAVAMSIYTRVWFPWIPLWILPLVFGLLAAGINFFGIKIVDKSEGILTVIKTGALVAFMAVAALVIFSPQQAAGHTVGVGNLSPFFPHGLSGFSQAVVICTFAYGIGAFAAATGNTINPRRDIPRATKGMAAGQIFFFTLPTLVLLTAVPWSQVSTKSSPFVTALDYIGINMGGNLLNGIVLISSFSALVASMFSAVIMLSSMAREKEAPAFLAAERRNLPINALFISAGALLLFSLVSLLLPKHIYNYAVSTTGYLSLITWGSILIARLILCMPQKNKGRMEWSGFTVTALGLTAILAISILSLQAPEQRLPFIFTVGSIIVFLGVGKLVAHKKEGAGAAGRITLPAAAKKPDAFRRKE